MSDKVKRGMIVAACVVIGVALTVLIAGNFKQPPKAKDTMAESQSTEVEVKPEIKKAETEKKPKETESKEETEELPQSTEKKAKSGSEAAGESGQDDGQPVQNIQPRVTKPETPAKEVLEDPTKKPDGETVTGAPVAENHDEVQQPETDTVPGAAPEGESQEGKIYAPGYGWIDDIGEGQVIEDSDIYENGNKIGVMD